MQRIGLGQMLQGRTRQAGGFQCGKIREAVCTRRHQLLCPALLKAADHAQAQAQRIALQRAVPGAEIHIYRQHFHAMRAGIADDLRRGIEAHRLGVEQRDREGRRVMAFQPGGDVHQQRKTGGMALGKTVAAETLDLPEAGLGKAGLIAACHHAPHHHVAKMLDRAEIAERGHGPAQAVRLLGREFGRHHGDLHRLFLEQRHAQGLVQNLLQLVWQIVGARRIRHHSLPARRRR